VFGMLSIFVQLANHFPKLIITKVQNSKNRNTLNFVNTSGFKDPRMLALARTDKLSKSKDYEILLP
jgi:hypothetical protein